MIFDASPIWFNLGLGLDTKMGALEIIQYEHDDVRNRFREMVYCWLDPSSLPKSVRRDPPNPLPSWVHLISVLEMKSVGCDNVAEVIRLMFNIPKSTQDLAASTGQL